MLRYLLTSFLIVLTYQIQAGWVIEKLEDGIKVYTRDNPDSDIKEFRAFADINAPYTSVEKVLLDYDHLDDWMPDISYSTELEHESYYKRIVYYRVDLPWPSDDRDIVVDCTIKKNIEKQETIIYMKENLTAKAEVDGFVRMKKIRGFWKINGQGNKTRVHYQVLAEPGGSLPTWLINTFVVDGPVDAIKALRKQV